jgi:hypothetical protein
MAATGMGLLLEEHRAEIVSAWRRAVEREIGGGEPALSFAVAPLLREMSLALEGQVDGERSHQARVRCAVLIRSSAAPAQLAREVKILHRCTWAVLRGHGTAVAQSERLAVDEWLDETLVEALERIERVRLRMAAMERRPVVVPAAARPRQTPPPLPRARSLSLQPPRAQPAQPVRAQPAQPVRAQPAQPVRAQPAQPVRARTLPRAQIGSAQQRTQPVPQLEPLRDGRR